MSNLTSLLKTKITIQRKSEFPDGYGGFIENWEDKKTIFAHIEYQGSVKYTIAQKLITEQKIKITTRKANIDQTLNRIKLDEKILKIDFINSFSKDFIEVLCSIIL